MKSCPTCNRTYHDEFSFCLVDGSILSAPYSTDETLVLPSSNLSYEKPTEVVESKPTHLEEVIEFVGNDEGYTQWLAKNPDGFVINTPKSKRPSYMALHRATCMHISILGEEYKGRWTERAYIKICSRNVESLREWVKQHGRPDGSFSLICSTCKPSDEIAPTVDDNWHGYSEGQQVTASEVVAKCLQYLNSGKVKNSQQKIQGIETISRYGQSVIVYSPQGKGWGNSPMNPNCWRTVDGKPI